MPFYRLEFNVPGQRPRSIDYACGEPLQPGQRIWADGVRLLVERVIKNKTGDTGPETVLCKLAPSTEP